MNYLNLLRVLTLIFSVSVTQSSFASSTLPEDWERKSDLWQAIHLFETNDLKGAAAIFKECRAGCPVAYPYYAYLHKKGFITQESLPQGQIVNYTFVHLKQIDPIFNSSSVMLEIKQNPKRRNKLFSDGRLSAYNKARYLEKNPIPKYGDPLNNYLDSSDPRSILAVLRIDPVKAKSVFFKGVSYYDIAIYMCSALQSHPKAGDVLFECYEHFYKNNQPLGRHFLDWSAGYGHSEAQVLCAVMSVTPELKAFFYGQAALNGNLYGIINIACAFEKEKGVPKDVCKAFAYYKQAAKHPNAEGVNFYNLAAAYEKGLGIQVNIKAAIENYILAIKAGHAECTIHAIRLLHRDGQFEEAFEYIQKAVEAKQLRELQGIIEWLPKNYTDKDLEMAVNFWATKAEQGNRIAQEYLAELILWYDIESKIVSPQICCDWLEELVKSTEFPCRSKSSLHRILGGYYKDTTQQYDLAFEHLKKSVELKNKAAHLALAQMYEDGLGIPRDTKKAMYHYSESCEDPNKWNSYGMYLMKEEVPNSYLRSAYDKKARENFEKCIGFGAENNNFFHLSCYNLGLLYLKKRTGENEKQQRAGVEKYLTEAADSGDKDAQRDLAIYYLKDQWVSAKNELPYLLATTQSVYSEERIKPLKSNHNFALRLLQQATNQNDGEAMRMLAMLKLYQQKSFSLEIMDDCIELLQKAYAASDISEKSQENIKNILCAFKVLAEDGVIELKNDVITLVTETETQELKQRLEKVPAYTSLLNDSQTEEDESDWEEIIFLDSNSEQSTEAEEPKNEIIEVKETKELSKEVKIDTPHDTRKKTSTPKKKKKRSNNNTTPTTTTTTTTTSTANIPILSDSDSEQEPSSRKERKLQKGLKKNNMKWRNVMKLFNLAFKVAGEVSMQPGKVSMQPGKGSVMHIQVGENEISMHKPHGRNSTNTDGGRMKSLGKVLNPNDNLINCNRSAKK